MTSCMLYMIYLTFLTFITALKTDIDGFDYKFHRYNQYDGYIDWYGVLLSEKYPDIVKVEFPMNTTEMRGIPVIKISKNPEIGNVIVFIEAGMHGNEWLSTAVAMYIIRELVENQKNVDLISDIDWYIAPVVNPDGYQYSFKQDRAWNKNKSNHKNCTGIDLNTNFNIHWKSTTNCKMSSGPRPFSEPETILIKNQILKSEDRIKIYLSLHCCGGKILHPWGYTKDLPENINQLLDMAQKIQKAMQTVRNTQYIIGNPSEWNEIYGSSLDWVKSVGKVNLSYMIELAGPIDNYIVPEDQIIPTAKEMFEGLKAIHKQIVHMYVDN